MAAPSNLHKNKLTGESYWNFAFELGIMFGETSMQAKIFWVVDVSKNLIQFPLESILISGSCPETGCH